MQLPGHFQMTAVPRDYIAESLVLQELYISGQLCY